MRDATPKIPPDRYKHLTAPENTAQVIEAMKAFLVDGDETAFEYAMAIYVAAARARNEPIEVVVGALREIGDVIEGTRHTLAVAPPTHLHALTFRGILRAFYGEVTVEHERRASARRKEDAPRHTDSGTWPKRSG